MSRKNRHFPQRTTPLVKLETDPFLAEQQALEMRRTERQKYEAALSNLTNEERIAFLNVRYARRSPMRRLIDLTIVCSLPGCERGTVELAGRSLGICADHALDVAQWWAVMADEQDQFTMKQAAIADRIHRDRKRAADEAKQKESRRDHPGWIYYLLVGDRIKIGYTVDVKRRLRDYPPDTPLLALHPGTKATEKDMHNRFAGSRTAGREWFLDTAEIREHIKQVIDQFGEPDRARYEHRGRMHSGLRAAAPKPTGISR